MRAQLSSPSVSSQGPLSFHCQDLAAQSDLNGLETPYWRAFPADHANGGE